VDTSIRPVIDTQKAASQEVLLGPLHGGTVIKFPLG
jgi:hypothetical protein